MLDVAKLSTSGGGVLILMLLVNIWIHLLMTFYWL